MTAWLKGHWQLIALTALVVVLWSTPIILPLKILVVFFHEFSHGAAAVLTGGDIVSMSLSADQGGVAYTRGGSRFVILTAGYLGSLICGVVLLLAALKSGADKLIIAALGVLVLVITALYMREVFPIVFGVVTGGALLAMARFLPHQVSDLTLRLIGLTSMIYVPRDIFSDTIERAHLRSDAFMLGELVGGGPQLWGGLWLIISLLTLGACLRYGLGDDSNLHFAKP